MATKDFLSMRRSGVFYSRNLIFFLLLLLYARLRCISYRNVRVGIRAGAARLRALHVFGKVRWWCVASHRTDNLLAFHFISLNEWGIQMRGVAAVRLFAKLCVYK